MSRRTPTNVTGGVYNSTPPVFTDGQFVAFQFDVNGNLLTTGGGGGGGNASVALVGALVPTSATMIGWDDGSGNVQFVSAANPLPITGSISATNPSVGTTGATAPTSATLLGVVVSGNLQPVSATFPVRVDPTGTTTQPVSFLSLPAGSNLIGQVEVSDGTNILFTSGHPGFVQGTIAVTAPALTAGWPVIGGETAQQTAAWTNATSPATTAALTVAGYSSVIVTLNQVGNCLSQTVFFEVSDTVAGTNWYSVYMVETDSTNFPMVSIALSTSTTKRSYSANVSGWVQFRLRMSAATAQSGTANWGIIAHQGTPAWGWTYPANSTMPVTATQTGTWTTRIVGAAGDTLDAALASGKPANALQVGGNDGTNLYGIPLASGGVSVLVSGTATISGSVTANAGTNLNTSLLALEGGNLAIVAGAVSSSIMQSNVAKINNVTPLMGNGVTGTGSQRVTVASDNTPFQVKVLGNAGGAFDAATNAAPPANAVQVGMVAATALPTAFTATDLVPPMTDKFGRQVVVTNTVRDLIGTFSVQTTDTSSHDLIAAVSGVFNDITNLVITIATATATEISLSDGTKTYKINIAATVGAGLVWAINGSLPASATNAAWTVTSSASVTLNFSGTYAKNK